MKPINLSTLANLIQAEKTCLASNNDFASKHEEAIDEMLKELPNGSGLDAGVKLKKELCTNDKIVFSFGWHHMDDNGYYDGWTEHNLIITPSLIFGFKMKITGRDKRGIKDYLYDLFRDYFTIK